MKPLLENGKLVQQPLLTRLHPMGPIPGNREPERALRADNASSETIMNRAATKTGHHMNSVAGEADTNALANILEDMILENKHAASSKDRIYTMLLRVYLPFIKISLEKLKSLVRVEEKFANETVQRERMS